MTPEQQRALAIAKVRRRRQPQLTQQTSKLDSAALGALDGITLGFADEIGSGLDYVADRILPGGQSRSYADILAANRGQQKQASEDNPATYIGGQIAGGVGLGGGMAGAGATMFRSGMGAGRAALVAGAEGAGYGAVAGAGGAEGGLKERAIGAGYGLGAGAIAGSGGSVALSGAARALRPAVDAVRNMTGPARTQAVNRIISQARNAGLDDAQINATLAELGPDAMLVDALGARGHSLARSAANTSPEARQTLESASYGRMAGQNDRVVGALEEASGLPRGNRRTVEQLKSDAYASVAPDINRAYDAARAAGYDLPREPFERVINSPMGRAAYDSAENSLRNRSAFQGYDAASELARLDQTKRTLDSRASAAFRSGDADTGQQASGLARALREAMDASIAGPEYADARALRQAAYRTDEAFDVGAELAGTRIPLDAPGRALSIEEANQPARAQGYAAELAEALLNRRNTPGAIDRLDTPMAREAMDAALGPNAEGVRRQLARERAFGSTHRAITGNSTTARQLAEMGAVGGVGAGLGLLGGMDYGTAGATGLALALAKRGGGAALRRVMAGNEEAVGSELARALIERGLPATPTGVAIAQSDPTIRNAIARSLAAQQGGMAAQP